MPRSSDTIAAVSTAVGPAARMILRLSGPDAWPLATALCQGDPSPAHPLRTRATFRDLAVPLTLYPFRGPRSYTGEDLVEFHLPGNPLLAQILLDELTRRGARLADPGEFTARAYFHGRLDLTEAEGVAATIAAQNESELRAARQLMSGELARRLTPTMDAIAETLALTEVGIDFSEEDVTFLPPDEATRRIAQADAALASLVAESARFEKLSHEPRVVLVGRPNAGKSTLLNALAGRERAVVSPIAGTTRDALSADVPLARGIIKLVDVAGLEAAGDHTVDQQMQARALREVETADLVILVHDVTSAELPITPPRPPDLHVYTKIDLAEPPADAEAIAVSAHSGQNLDQLRHRLDALAFGSPSSASTLALNARHLQAITDARAALARAAGTTTAGAELLALELRDALDALGRVLGSMSPDDVLGRIFSTFCIGK